MNTNPLTKKFNNIALSIITLAFVACGGGSSSSDSFVSGINLDSFVSEGDQFIDVSTELDLGNTTLPTIAYPIINDSANNPVGTLEIRSILGGASELAFSLNLTKALDGKILNDDRLPNGNKIPIGGLQGVPVFSYDLDGSNSKVYLALGPGVAMVGVALNIKQFGGVESNIGNVNFFPRFNRDGIDGVAGLYTSREQGKGGIAIFVNATSLNIPGLSPQAKAESFVALAAAPTSNKAVFMHQEPKRKAKRRLLRKMYKLNKKRSQLTID